MLKVTALHWYNKHIFAKSLPPKFKRLHFPQNTLFPNQQAQTQI